MRIATAQDAARHLELKRRLQAAEVKMAAGLADAMAARLAVDLGLARARVARAEDLVLRAELSALRLELGYPTFPPAPPAELLTPPTTAELEMVRAADEGSLLVLVPPAPPVVHVDLERHTGHRPPGVTLN